MEILFAEDREDVHPVVARPGQDPQAEDSQQGPVGEAADLEAEPELAPGDLFQGQGGSDQEDAEDGDEDPGGAQVMLLRSPRPDEIQVNTLSYRKGPHLADFRDASPCRKVGTLFLNWWDYFPWGALLPWPFPRGNPWGDGW